MQTIFLTQKKYISEYPKEIKENNNTENNHHMGLLSHTSLSPTPIR